VEREDPGTDIVIILTRLGGSEMAVNPDLIERAEPTPDTVITMVDGHKIVVGESVDEVVRLVRTWRASVAAEAFGLSQDLAAGAGRDIDDPRVNQNLLSAQEVTDHSALGNTLARVLRMPPRGE
jgi:flagellar protein FlbD